MNRDDLFDTIQGAPLAERMRPAALTDVVGHPHLTEPTGQMQRALRAQRPPSMVLWGPPGCGKTTLARLIAKHVHARFVALSAVLSGVAQVREVISRAREEQRRGRSTLLFVDEIHRFNKAQQDAFLPHVESGLISLVGATTENPSFALNNALLSRCTVVVLQPLATDDLVRVLESALSDPRGYGEVELEVEQEALESLAAHADGDARRALNTLESIVEPQLTGADKPRITAETLRELSAKGGPRYDRGGDTYYHVMSALIKSMRGSDPDAALYWLARLLDAGEDPRTICRRLVVFASEDVGNADPRALPLATSAAQAHELIGLPESRIPLAQAVTFLATAPKSDASYRGLRAAQQGVKQHGSLQVPIQLRNANTALHKALGFGQGYQNPHQQGGFERSSYLPDRLQGARFYHPTVNGYEAHIKQRLEVWRELRQAAPNANDDDEVSP